MKKLVASALTLCLVLAAGTGISATLEERVAASSKAIALDPSAPPKEDTSALVAKHSVAAQKEIAGLYKELKAMRGQRFGELGFSVNNKPAVDWKKRTEAARERIASDSHVAPIVKTGPGNLLLLGQDRAWRQGGQSKYSPSYEKNVQDALNWKMEE